MIIVRFNSFVQKNNTFWIRKSDYFEEVSKAIKLKIKGFEKFDFFLHKIIKDGAINWIVSEGISGARVSDFFKLPKEAIQQAEKILADAGASKAELKIKELVNHKMISPRYRFVVSPNKIRYVATKQDKDSKPVLPRRYRVQVLEE
jgi:hypothetical protein